MYVSFYLQNPVLLKVHVATWIKMENLKTLEEMKTDTIRALSGKHLLIQANKYEEFMFATTCREYKRKKGRQ